MTTWQDEQRAFSDQIWDNVQAFADEMTRLDSQAWTIKGDRVREGEHNTFVRLVRADELAIYLNLNRHKKTVVCAPSVPLWPSLSGEGFASLKDYIGKPDREAAGLGENGEASISLTRYTGQTVTAARDLYRRVVVPYAKVWPVVVARLSERLVGLDAQRSTAARIAEAFGGTVHDRNRGDTLYVGFPGVLPSMEVRYGGSIRTTNPLNIPESVIGDLFAALKKTENNA